MANLNHLSIFILRNSTIFKSYFRCAPVYQDVIKKYKNFINKLVMFLQKIMMSLKQES